MAFVVHFSPFDGRQVSSPYPKKNPNKSRKAILSLVDLDLEDLDFVWVRQIL